ncbi:hypothetical protein I5Q34_03810 [Streptomyces sp. AV19]|uniref:hypothetical protein n=1 Tax=Streptomyces sp. AV19 TaxID=2793068 RepID=UPI0018FEA156|nr:hypothetical protein [Streptomyces sp. AV19]MBH1933420.1 hypothetical protein [Streptomyces sp. AV19]MDG4532051.1 hypothetical protein [Streptomyces sp. AV19]
MSEARTDTTEARPLEASAQAAAAGSGRHRGPQSSDESHTTTHGRHRRVSDGG